MSIYKHDFSVSYIVKIKTLKLLLIVSHKCIRVIKTIRRWCCWSHADGDKEEDLYNHAPTARLQGDGDDDDGDNDYSPIASERDSDDDDGDYDYAPAGLDENGADDDDYCEYALAMNYMINNI